MSLKPQRKARALWSLSLTTQPEAEDAVVEFLTRFAGEQAVVTHDLSNRVTTVTAYVANGRFWTPKRKRELTAGLKQLHLLGLDTWPSRIRWKPVPAEDWRESWKRHFPALSIGKALLVRPSWSRRRPRKGEVEVVLDPGLSFGTGQHPTTAYCLAELVRFRPRRQRDARTLLDVGTGSGILAIAGAKLGYSSVQGLEPDLEALEVARRNGIENHVAAQISWKEQGVEDLPLRATPRFDVVMANLTSDLLVKHGKRLLRTLAPAGHLVLAGILREEFSVVRSAFEKLGARMLRQGRRGEWHSATFASAQDH